MQRIALVGQQFHRLADAARLVDAALFADRQVHRQVQERVGVGRVGRAHGSQCRIDIAQGLVVLGVLGDPEAGNRLDRLQRLAVARLGIDRAEKSPHIGLTGLDQHGADCRPQIGARKGPGRLRGRRRPPADALRWQLPKFWRTP
jgi:hypothetical protein